MIDTFDIVAYLEDRGHDVHYPGEKNVSQGWVNITCPYAWCDDPSWHMGINLETKFYSCYKCGEKGFVTTLMQELEGGCSLAEVNGIIDEFQDVTFPELKKEVLRPRHSTLHLPKGSSKDFPSIHYNYLKGRRFDPDFLIERYDLYAIHNLGEYGFKFRIVIPIYLEGKMVSYTALDVTGKKAEEDKYRNCPNENTVIPTRQCLYNLDSVEDKVLIVEGPADVWRWGQGAVGMFGVKYTLDQVGLLLTRKKVKKAFVMFDTGEEELRQAYKLAGTLNSLIPHVEVLELPSGDPDDLSDEEVRELRKDLGFD